MTLAQTAAALQESMPNKTFKIEGKPTYETIKELENQMAANGMACHESKWGYMGDILTDEAYKKATNNDQISFVAPQEPAEFSVGTLTTPGAIAMETKKWEKAHNEYNNFVNFRSAICTLIKNAIDKVWLQGIWNEITNIQHKTPREIFKWLYEQYGEKDSLDWDEIQTQLREEIDGNRPFSEVFQKYEDLEKEALNCEPKVEIKTQMVPSCLLLIVKTGMHNEACKEWVNTESKKTSDTTSDWDRFKTFFTKKQNRSEKFNRFTTAASVGYGGASANAMASPSGQTVASGLTNDYTLPPGFPPAPASVAASIQNSIEFSALTNDNREMRQQLQSTLEEVKTLRGDIAAMAQHKPAELEPAAKRAKISTDTWNGGYCWTHGFNVGDKHSSWTCKNPTQNHKKEATAANRMGGSEDGKPACFKPKGR
jgi:hypothetical protein